MASWVFIVESNCTDPAREAEFNDWYNNIHVPDLLKAGYINKATRYELNTPPVEGRGKYLAVYEIESDDIDATMKEMGQKLPAITEGRMSPIMKATNRGIFKKVMSISK